MREERKGIIREYNKKDLERLSFVVNTTIHKSYVEYYSPEAIEYFLKLHAKGNMKKDIPNGFTFILEKKALTNGVLRLELCASLPSKDFYLALGYKIVRFTHFLVNNNKKLEYYDMEKYLVEV
ncbi:MAG: hypothetical protein P8Z50_03245 [candidate division WOR-3 bacterium]